VSGGVRGGVARESVLGREEEGGREVRQRGNRLCRTDTKKRGVLYVVCSESVLC